MLLAVKLLIAPFFIAIVTLAGRRWGPAISGTLTGLPLTSGPVSLILALQYGPDFAARAAIGNLAGQASMCSFCLAYSLAAQRCNWRISTLIAITVFLVATAVLNSFTWSLLAAAAFLLVVIGLVSRLIPQYAMTANAIRRPNWDLPARMIIAAIIVLALTTFANALGPQLSGLIAPFPVFGTVLAVFAHQQQGPVAAARLLRGVVVGSLAFFGFFLVVGQFLPGLSTALTYSLATMAALAASALAVSLGHRPSFAGATT
jgi:hypothetical protein